MRKVKQLTKDVSLKKGKSVSTCHPEIKPGSRRIENYSN